MATPNEAKLLPLGMMARVLRVPVAWLRGEADAGRVPCLKAGKSYLFVPEVVERELAKRAASPPDTPEPRAESS